MAGSEDNPSACQQMDGQRKCNTIHTEGSYYSAFKKWESLLFDTTWMDLEDIMLNEISQA
jgi:hypothetical protein